MLNYFVVIVCLIHHLQDILRQLTATRSFQTQPKLCIQEEEQVRNRVMYDLLYVNPYHTLAQTILFYNFNQMPPNQRYSWPIDTNASGGMNGSIWLCERNGWRVVLPSPVSGLPDIMNNQVLNATYLNPLPHQHIPVPPKGVAMPKRILKPFDIKPLPVLWHEDNSGRRQQNRDRPLVPGAISGLQLGEAAHRLLKNSLNIKSSQTFSGFSEQMWLQNSPGNHVAHMPRAAGPSGYERGFSEDPSYFHSPQGVMGSPRFGLAQNGFQGNRQNFKAQERYLHQEQYHNLGNGMSNLTLGGVRTRPNAMTSPRMPNSGQSPNARHQFAQNIGPPPSPPRRWIGRPTGGTSGMYEKQHVKQVYQIKGRIHHNLSDPGFQQ